ncbi:membrane protein insertase YidC [Rubrimonas cliftonensis]|uniref:Membrane protein insertase YidC n=1 Tax=Rubrimonas cliftonensis TaxID=89524 RepID=A0A1H3YWH6_9RHOB|nr:membrane protein insertase YidC [Rubrimonas cliftonensis]SEA15909.1 protein translocase subunit yidC [Rubrimonas cliftonensis]
MGEQKNMILAAALSFLVIVVWQVFLAPPPPALNPQLPPAESVAGAPDAPGPIAAAPTSVPRAEALARSARVPIDTPKLRGSLSLKGGRIDHLDLTAHRQTNDPGSPAVELLEPTGAANPYYALWGWTPARGSQTGPLPDAETEWALAAGDRLAPGAQVTLEWDNGAGLVFLREIAVDENYMFTVTQTVANRTDAALSLAPYAIIARHGEPQTINFYILHEGAIGEIDGVLKEYNYSDMLELPADPAEGGPVERLPVANNGWLGFTDKYWMTALAGGADRPFTAVFKATGAGLPVFQTDLRQPALTVAPGESASASSMLFAGAKETRQLQEYEDTRGIGGFVDAVDWGWFFFLTKPIHWMLLFIHDIVGNMGWAIILLTVVIKTLLFPLAYKSFVSMSRMKNLQPEMEKIKERVGDDKMKMQQEMIALYKREKVNPAAGCIPILLQIPIFFSLYKVIFVSLELRHAPFIGWIQDLSAPDPTSWMNLFGLLPFETSAIPAFLTLFSIGVYPIIMGITMWMQQKLNPAPTDPIQAQIFAIMPFMFMFLLGTFASGLVIYWIANNVLTFAQQYTIMRSQGVDVNFFGNVKRTFKRKRPVE